MNYDLAEQDLVLRARLLGSFLLFTQMFYKLRTGRDFNISFPTGRESHFITLARALTRISDLELLRLIINIPPRYGKSELLIHHCAWCLAKYPDSNSIYVSYSLSLAKKQTQTIRSIIQMPEYRKLFGVELLGDTQAKDNFETVQGGSVYAVGSQGTITGRGAGIRGVKRYGGAIYIDDIIKPEEATSDLVREGINDWYYNTLLSRLNEPSYTPIINNGQRTHETDLAGVQLLTGEWEACILPALDAANNALYPEVHTTQQLLKMKAESPYVFAAQYQQDPMPAGGGIFNPENFVLLDVEPKILQTFIVVDTAETEKTYNDATAFSMFGIYKIENYGRETEDFGLHWIDCEELRIEPKDLESNLIAFYGQCMMYHVKPKVIIIEKASTGTYLISLLRDKFRGLDIREIEVKGQRQSKTDRFLQIQPYVNRRLISMPRHGKHVSMCLEHMRKITANNSHRFDDIADTVAHAVRVSLIDKTLSASLIETSTTDKMVAHLAANFNKQSKLRAGLYGLRS